MMFELGLVGTTEDILEKLYCIPALFDEGLPFLHLRTKNMTESGFRATLNTISSEYHPRIVIHSYYELALTYPLRGIHLTEAGKMIPESDLLFKNLKNKIISASFHSLAALKQNQRAFQYVLLSPIFDSISKSGYKSAFSLEELKIFLAEFKKDGNAKPRVMALGGVGLATIDQVIETGFDGAMFMSDIWSNSDPVRRFVEIRKKAEAIQMQKS